MCSSDLTRLTNPSRPQAPFEGIFNLFIRSWLTMMIWGSRNIEDRLSSGLFIRYRTSIFEWKILCTCYGHPLAAFNSRPCVWVVQTAVWKQLSVIVSNSWDCSGRRREGAICFHWKPFSSNTTFWCSGIECPPGESVRFLCFTSKR